MIDDAAIAALIAPLQVAYERRGKRVQASLFEPKPIAPLPAQNIALEGFLTMAARSAQAAATAGPVENWSDEAATAAQGLLRIVELAERYDPTHDVLSAPFRIVLPHVAAVERTH